MKENPLISTQHHNLLFKKKHKYMLSKTLTTKHCTWGTCKDPNNNLIVLPFLLHKIKINK